MGAKISQLINNDKKKKKEESSTLTIKESGRNEHGEPKFFNKPADRQCVHYPRLSHRPHPCVYIAISELVRICGRPEFHRHIFRGRNGRNYSSVTGHRHFDEEEGRMDTPRLIAAAFYRRHGDASLRSSTLSRVKFKSLHARFTFSDLREFEGAAFFSRVANELDSLIIDRNLADRSFVFQFFARNERCFK